MTPIHHGGGFLLTGSATSGTIPNVFDNRGQASYGFLYFSGIGASAIVDVLASYNGTAWMKVMTVTAVAGTVGISALVSAFYPYLGARVTNLYSGAAGTAAPVLHWTPGSI